MTEHQVHAKVAANRLYDLVLGTHIMHKASAINHGGTLKTLLDKSLSPITTNHCPTTTVEVRSNLGV